MYISSLQWFKNETPPILAKRLFFEDAWLFLCRSARGWPTMGDVGAKIFPPNPFKYLRLNHDWVKEKPLSNFFSYPNRSLLVSVLCL